MDQLNAIACDSCRSKKCKCDRIIPSCTQCKTSSTICRYQEGGKRGIPAAYMNALEKRLADTEAALTATLSALQNQAAMPVIERHLAEATETASRRQHSKAEKLEEWKQLPLGNCEQLAAWHQARDRKTVTSEVSHSDTGRPVSNAEMQDPSSIENSANQSRQMHKESRPLAMNVLEQLRCCDVPVVPNARIRLSDSGRWQENYF